MKHKSRKLLNVLFILIVIPVVLLLFRSGATMVMQRRAVTEISGRYVRQLARQGAARFNAPDDEHLLNFLSLLNDHGYERALRRREPRLPRQDWEERQERSGKFIPGFLAYVRRDGTFIVGSDRSEILPSLWLEHAELEQSFLGSVEVKGEEMAYSICAWPTSDPDVIAVAAVTLFTWIGGNGFVLGQVANQTLMLTLFCLIVLLMLRRVLIRPLRTLSSELRTFAWGKEVPAIDMEDGGLFGLQVEEIASLRTAIVELAQEAVARRELENRYVGDIVKAQEDERNRLAREIHDGPIQVVAALMQRIQMASLSPEVESKGELRAQLALAEEVAQNVVEDLRGVCDSLVPPWVSLGIARCMEEMALRLARQHDVVIDVDVDLFVELSQDKTLALFRIFQEGVSNAVRHGKASHIVLSVTQDETSDEVLFVLRDNGSGFDVDSVGIDELYAAGRRGLAGMIQRVEGFGGTFSIASVPGDTSIQVRFSLD